MAGILFFVTKEEKPEPITLPSGPDPVKTTEYELVSQALHDPEAIIQIDETEDTPLEQSQPSSSSSILSPTASLLAGNTGSQSAPELIPASLESSTQRIYLSGASLQQEAFTDISSIENLSIIRTLINKSTQSID